MHLDEEWVDLDWFLSARFAVSKVCFYAIVYFFRYHRLMAENFVPPTFPLKPGDSIHVCETLYIPPPVWIIWILSKCLHVTRIPHRDFSPIQHPWGPPPYHHTTTPRYCAHKASGATGAKIRVRPQL